jgi:hypothetical protein
MHWVGSLLLPTGARTFRGLMPIRRLFRAKLTCSPHDGIRTRSNQSTIARSSIGYLGCHKSKDEKDLGGVIWLLAMSESLNHVDLAKSQLRKNWAIPKNLGRTQGLR